MLFGYERLYEKIADAERVVFVEEGIKNGGFSMVATTELALRFDEFRNKKYKILAIDDNFASPENSCDLLTYVGISPKSIVEAMRSL